MVNSEASSLSPEQRQLAPAQRQGSSARGDVPGNLANAASCNRLVLKAGVCDQIRSLEEAPLAQVAGLQASSAF
eukprot:4229565-Amphidinium_carterae.1